MKKKLFALTLALIFVFSPFIFSSCGDDEPEIVTEVKFTSYDLGDGDMISFYMTSDVKPNGVWEYTIENGGLFSIISDNEETNERGIFGLGGSASYKTLILKPIGEGEAVVSFKLTEGDTTAKYSVKITKDGSKFKAEVKEI